MAGIEWAEHGRDFTCYNSAMQQYQFEKQMANKKKMMEDAVKYKTKFYPYQKYLHDYYLGEISDRKIMVVLDKKGGTGKSAF